MMNVNSPRNNIFISNNNNINNPMNSLRSSISSLPGDASFLLESVNNNNIKNDNFHHDSIISPTRLNIHPKNQDNSNKFRKSVLKVMKIVSPSSERLSLKIKGEILY